MENKTESKITSLPSSINDFHIWRRCQESCHQPCLYFSILGNHGKLVGDLRINRRQPLRDLPLLTC